MGENVIISSVVKVNVYGHGIKEFSPIVKKFGLNHFSVYNADDVVLIGSQGELTISVTPFSELSNWPDYELLTRLNYNIPRKVV